jgi:peptidoglycan/LPS O-acetylase OafA/YrhL
MGRAPTRQSSMDILRLAAMVAVFVYHLDELSPVPTSARHLGDVGITLFVMLSGYGLARSQGDRPVSFGAFMARKAWRILPSYWLSLALIAIGLTAFTHKRPTGLDWAAHASGLHALWPASPYGATVAANLWFLSLIMALYALFPWLHRRLSTAPRSLGLIGLVLSHWLLWQAAHRVPGASLLLHYRGIQYVSPFFAFNVLPFGLGVLLARVVAERSRWPALAAAAVATYYASIGLSDVALGVAAFGAVMLTPQLPAPLGRVLARLTAASYEFYLLHHALMGPFYRYWMLHTHAAPRWLFAVVYAASILAVAEGAQRAAAWCVAAIAQRGAHRPRTSDLLRSAIARHATRGLG